MEQWFLFEADNRRSVGAVVNGSVRRRDRRWLRQVRIRLTYNDQASADQLAYHWRNSRYWVSA